MHKVDWTLTMTDSWKWRRRRRRQQRSKENCEWKNEKEKTHIFIDTPMHIQPNEQLRIRHRRFEISRSFSLFQYPKCIYDSWHAIRCDSIRFDAIWNDVSFTLWNSVIYSRSFFVFVLLIARNIVLELNCFLFVNWAFFYHFSQLFNYLIPRSVAKTSEQWTENIINKRKLQYLFAIQNIARLALSLSQISDSSHFIYFI